MKKVGIIGGVGPSATVDLYRLIIKNTPAEKDQEHLRVLIDSHPQIPDRTKAILENGESPVEAMLESAQILESAGVDFLAIPCNTAHYFLPDLVEKVDIPFVNMIEETAKFLKKNGVSSAGLLSTSGTAKTGIYQKELDRLNIKTVVPSEEGIEKEMKAIYGEEGIKAGVKFEKSQLNRDLFKEVVEELGTENIEAVIMGCTEIPLCLDKEVLSEWGMKDLILVNPTEVLAKAIINKVIS